MSPRSALLETRLFNKNLENALAFRSVLPKDPPSCFRLSLLPALEIPIPAAITTIKPARIITANLVFRNDARRRSAGVTPRISSALGRLLPTSCRLYKSFTISKSEGNAPGTEGFDPVFMMQ